MTVLNTPRILMTLNKQQQIILYVMVTSVQFAGSWNNWFSESKSVLWVNKYMIIFEEKTLGEKVLFAEILSESSWILLLLMVK